MDSNKRGFSLFGSYQLNDPVNDVPGRDSLVRSSIDLVTDSF